MNLTKRWGIRLSIILILLLTACGNQTTEDEQHVDSALTSLIQNDIYSYSTTEDGFYYLSTNQIELDDGTTASHLMYIDYATGQEIYLCSDSSCQHDHEDCTSVIPTPNTNGKIFVWNDYLYYLECKYDYSGYTCTSIVYDESYGSGGLALTVENAKLYQMNLDGSNRKVIYTFEDNVTIENVVFGDTNGLYFITKTIEAQEITEGSEELESYYYATTNREMIRLNPDTGDVKYISSLDFDDNLDWDIIGCANQQFILRAYQYPDTMTSQEFSMIEDKEELTDTLNKTKILYATFDITTKEMQQIYQISANDSSTDTILQNDLYISNETTGDIIKVNLETKEESILSNLEANYIYGTIGNYLYCVNSSDVDDAGYYFIHTETGEITHSNLVNQSTGWDLDILAIYDTYALVIYDYEYQELSDDAYDITAYQYGFIALEDLIQGKENYIPISMSSEGM